MTIISLDTSALLKRALIEPQSLALADYLDAQAAAGALLIASSIAWLEVWRIMYRTGVTDGAHEVEAIFTGVAEYRLDEPLLVQARRIGDSKLRALDAIHLASAVAARATEIVTYDRRLADSALALGLDVSAPE